MAERRALGTAVLAFVALVLPASAAAAPPNDNYLASYQMQTGEVVDRDFRDTVFTADATVQSDLFNPNRDGLPFGGGGAEPASCGPTGYGRTVWYDFIPEISGGVEIHASGYDTVVAVYEYDVDTARLGKPLLCQNGGGGAEDVLIPKVEGGKAYTVQVGAVGGVGGTLQFEFLFFGDRDEDGVLDEAPDRCLNQPGIDAAGGCPPRLAAAPSLEWANTANGVRFTSVLVRGVPRGGRVEARCRRCGVRRTVARGRGRGRVVKLRKLVGREAPSGAVLEVFITQRPQRRGRYRHGAIGNYVKYTFEPGGLRKRVTRCLRPGSMKPRRRCT
jgi:hypothetical protein